MGNKKKEQWRSLSVEETAKILEEAQTKTKRGGSAFVALRVLMQGKNSIKQNVIADAFWPDKNDKENNLRQLKKRLNDVLSTLTPACRISPVPDKDIRLPMKEKDFFIEQIETFEDKLEKQPINIIDSNNKPYNLKNWVERDARSFAPFARFPERVETFALNNFPKIWEQYDESIKNYLKNLSVKFETIKQIIPSYGNNSPIVGFEVLAIGPGGENFGSIKQWYEKNKVGEAEINAILFFLAVLSVIVFKIEAGDKINDLFFDINLDTSLLNKDKLKYVLNILENNKSQLRGIQLEIMEDTKEEHLSSLKNLLRSHPMYLSLDDANKLLTEIRVDILATKLCKCIKVDNKYAKKIFEESNNDPEKAISKLKEIAGNTENFIVEGIENTDDLLFLKNRWISSCSNTYLCVQGYLIHPEDDWKEKIFTNLENFGHKCGYSLKTSFMSKQDIPPLSLLEETVAKIEKENLIIEKIETKIGNDNFHKIILKDDFKICIWEDNLLEFCQNKIFNDDFDFLVVKNLSEIRLLQEDINDKRFSNLKSYGNKYIFSKIITLDNLNKILFYIKMFKRVPESIEDRTELYNRINFQIQNWGEQEIIPIDESENRNALDLLLEWEQQDERIKNKTSGNIPICYVLGEFGMGKTFLTRVFTHELIEKRQKGEIKRIPFYMDLRDIKSNIQSFTYNQILGFFLIKRGFSEIDVPELLDGVKKGRILLIFDGLDEIATSLPVGDTLGLIRQLRAPATDNAKVIITCRTHFFKNRTEELSDLKAESSGVLRDSFNPASFRTIYIQPFNEKQIHQYLGKRLGNEADKAFELLCKVHDLKDLSRRPIHLSMIVDNYEKLESIADKNNVIGATDLYNLYINSWLEWDKEKVHNLPPDIKLFLMEELSAYLWNSESQKTSISYKDLTEWFREKYKNEIGFLPPDFGAAAEKELRTASFITRDAEGKYSFSHKSYLEFFLARRFAKGIEKQKSELLCSSMPSQEVIDFCIPLLQEEKAIEFLKQILASPYKKGISENSLIILYYLIRTQIMGTEFIFDKIDLLKREFSSILPEGIDLKEANIFGLDLRCINLTKANLEKANFEKTNFAYSTLVKANLKNTVLSFGNFDYTNMEEADLSNAKAHHTSIRNANINSCSLNNTDLSFSILAYSDMERVDLNNSDLFACGLAYTKVDEKELVKAKNIFGVGGKQPIFSEFETTPQSGHKGSVNSVAFTYDSKLIASGSDDKTIRIWDAEKGNLLHVIIGHKASVNSVIFSHDSKLIASGNRDITIRICDTEKGNLLHILKGHEYSINSIAFSHDSKLIASGSDDKTIRIWDTVKGNLLHIFKGHEAYVYSVVFSHNSRIIASGSDDKTIRIWDAEKGNLLYVLKGHEDSVNSIAFSHDSKLIASGSYDKTIRIWDAKKGNSLHILKGHEDYTNLVALSYDSKLIVSGSDDKTIRIWDAEKGNLLHVLKGHEDYVNSLALSHDSKLIASGSDDKTIRIWDAEKGNLLHVLKGHEDHVSSLAFSSHSSKYIAARNRDSTIRIWDTDNGNLLHKNHETSIINFGTFSLDSKYLVSDNNNSLFYFDFNRNPQDIEKKLYIFPNNGWFFIFKGNKFLSNESGKKQIGFVDNLAFYRPDDFPELDITKNKI